MKAWRVGDPVGTGELYLPTAKIRDAYGKACRSAQIDSAAKHAISLSTLHLRREFIDRYPADARDALKDRVRKLWEERNGRV